MVFCGTCMGSASSHSNVNLPALLAGGGFKHGQHLAFDPRMTWMGAAPACRRAITAAGRAAAARIGAWSPCGSVIPLKAGCQAAGLRIKQALRAVQRSRGLAAAPRSGGTLMA